MLHFAAFSGGALAESLLALLQYKREQPLKAEAKKYPSC